VFRQGQGHKAWGRIKSRSGSRSRPESGSMSRTGDKLCSGSRAWYREWCRTEGANSY